MRRRRMMRDATGLPSRRAAGADRADLRAAPHGRRIESQRCVCRPPSRAAAVVAAVATLQPGAREMSDFIDIAGVDFAYRDALVLKEVSCASKPARRSA
jgi:hypothetical protein